MTLLSSSDKTANFIKNVQLLRYLSFKKYCDSDTFYKKKNIARATLKKYRNTISRASCIMILTTLDVTLYYKPSSPMSHIVSLSPTPPPFWRDVIYGRPLM